MENKMLEKQKQIKNKFLLTAEQKVALMEAKVQRAEAQVAALVKQAKLLEQPQLRR
jgi:hypothetical protein